MTPKKNMGKLVIDPAVEPIDPKLVPRIKLPSGNMMPVAAYGTFHSDWAQNYMYEATLEAIRIGWRHIDTARAYENEDVIGDVIKDAISKGYINSTNDLFITGKLWNGHMAKEDVRTAANPANPIPTPLTIAVVFRILIPTKAAASSS